MWTIRILIVLIIALAVRLYWRDERRSKTHNPPSPRSLPFIGAIMSVPPGPEHLAYMQLGKELNTDIIFLKFFGKSVLVLNSAQAASDLLEKRSSNYSDRDLGPMLTDPTLMDWSTNVLAVRYGDLWRHYRRMLNNWLNARGVVQFHSLQQDQVHLLLQRLVQVSENRQPFHQVRSEFIYMMASTMFQLAYGYQLQGQEDAWFQRCLQTNHDLVTAPMFSNFLVNAFPVLKYVPDWFPGAGWKRTAKIWRERKEIALDEPYEWSKSQAAAGTPPHSIISALLQGHKLVSHLSTDERDRRLKELAFIIYAGGTDTSSSLLVSFVAAMVQNPDSQTKAQEELEKVLGPVTLPTIPDRERLPYVNNLIQEVMRFYPVTPGGVPRSCFNDDTYRGYSIPKGTIVIANMWAMTRDVTHYPDPEVFNPDRYLDTSVPPAPGFGWGRRKCPGIHYAEDSAFITIASLLSVFKFSKLKSVDGSDIEPKIEYGSSSVSLELKPFDFEYYPRSEAHRQLLLSELSCA